MFEPKIRVWPFWPLESMKDRRKHVLKVLLEFFAFLVLGFLQWILMITILRDWTIALVRNHTSAILLAFIVGLFLLLLFSISHQLRHKFGVNWFVVMVIVECSIVSLSLLIVNSGVLQFLVGLLVVAFVFAVAILVGFFIPWDITKDAMYLYIASTGFYLMSLYAMVMYAVLDVPWAFYIFAGLIACVVLLFLLYHVQCIMGGRKAQTELGDDKYAALLLFHEFVALFVLTLYWRPIMQRFQLKQ